MTLFFFFFTNNTAEKWDPFPTLSCAFPVDAEGNV